MTEQAGSRVDLKGWAADAALLLSQIEQSVGACCAREKHSRLIELLRGYYFCGDSKKGSIHCPAEPGRAGANLELHTIRADR